MINLDHDVMDKGNNSKTIVLKPAKIKYFINHAR